MSLLRQIARRVLPDTIKQFLRSLIQKTGKPRGGESGPLWAAHELLKMEHKIARMSQRSKHLFAVLKGQHNLKLHLGCGDDIRPGWVNIDIRSEISSRDQIPNAVFIPYDLRVGLPLEDASCEYVYSSHFWEHLEESIGVELIRQCYRVLQPGGTFRIALPTFHKAFEAYVRHDEEFFSGAAHFLTLSFPKAHMIDHINLAVYNGNGPMAHKCCYDPEKIIYVLEYTGFSQVALSPFCKDVDVGSELRTRYTFYVDAVK